MNKPSNLSSVLHDLKSEKVKERQQGLAALRTVFERDSVVLTLDESGKGQAWLSVFQALYTTVGIEKATSFKKSSHAAASRRLGEAAATVRWLAERSVQRMNKAVVKSLFTHLTQTMVHNGELFTPVALDYIKALKCLVNWTPHMDHLNEDIWERMVEMAFNVILGDPIRGALDDEDGPDEDYEVTAPGTDPDSSEFYLDDEPDDNDDDNLPSTSTAVNPRKRRQREPGSAPRSSPPRLKPKRNTPRSVSLEQIEFTSLLAVLLQSPSAPLLSPQAPYLGSAVLRRLYRFLERYPADTSLHHDYILCLSATLSHLALNKKSEVETFARDAWDGLLDLWRTKNKAIKEGLASILQVLFPYLTTEREGASTSHHWADGVQRLWHLLDGEAESRWGVDGLSLDSLRLEVGANRCDGEDAGDFAVFVAQTYRAGWHFDAGQALAWAILELQADCAEKLFQLSESVHSSPSKSSGKRVKLENPIASLLHSIQTHLVSSVRAYHLQILLFFIDRYWSILHDSLQQDVISTLLQFVAFDDAIIQSWTFLCFAAIAHFDASAPHPVTSQKVKPDRPRDSSIWDPIWTHAIRRANVPGVCRAACHAACVLLSHAKQLLTSQRVLVEIETLAKDLDVQGPAFPYDSVCVFLAQCLRVSSQDVRLHRMQIEDKVLGWLLDSWGIADGSTLKGSGSGQSRMLLYMICDVLLLLESVCGFSKRINLIFRILLPDCAIMETMADRGKTKVIQDFLLNGRLPPFRLSEIGNTTAEAGTTNELSSPSIPAPLSSGDLAQPRGSERRMSAYLLKSLDAFALAFESLRDTNGHPTAEKARQALDLAVIALSFESLLVLNGTRSTRRVIQAACKLITLVTALLPDHQWTVEEKALVLLGLEPLTCQELGEDDAGWEAIISPDAGTGIKSQVLKRLISNSGSQRGHQRALRRGLQRIILQSADVQDTFSKVMTNLRDVLRIIIGQKCNDSRALHSVNDADDKDGFGPIRITQQAPETRQQIEDRIAHRYIVEVCVSFLAVIPILQSTSGEPTRDKELMELVLESDSKFHLVASVFFKNVKQRLLNLSANNLGQFLRKLEGLLKQYNYSRSEKLQLLVTQFLDSTLHIWLQDAMTGNEVGEDIRALCHWISSILKDNKIRSWKLRDYVVRFLDRYLHMDPNQRVWSRDNIDIESLPANLLPLLGADRDVRVRFRVAVVNARLFSIARAVGQDALILYDTIKDSLTVELHNYEHMLTRMLSLGNIMVASSAVRRGPYWHILEICLHSQSYNRHIEAILIGVSERLGLASFSMLFEAYASQIAYSIRQAQSDFLRFPPHLLGYQDRRDCAKAAFRGFTPTNVLAGGASVSDVEHGQRLFMNHCKVIQKSAAEGLRACFGEIIGFQIVAWIDEDLPTENLDQLIKGKIMNVEGLGDFEGLLRQHVDGIVIAILRTLQNQDFSHDGIIVGALRAANKSEKVIRTFQALTRYRRVDDFEFHPPNLPNYGTTTISRSLAWFNSRVPDTNNKATSYHVLHELFAELQHSPFVNEQIRLLNAISLWVALHHDDFEELTLLHTLIHGATSILAQSDLARAAQSILEWALNLYRRIGQKDPCIPDILIRTRCLTHDYSLDTRDVAVAKLGSDLGRWIDNQTLALCKSTTLRSQVVKALPAWPQQPSVDLTKVFEDITAGSLSAVLGDYRISSNRFRVVRRLRDLADERLYEEEDFAKMDFWRLKECIPPADQLQDDDINAFASLLIMNKGHIQSFWREQSSSQSVRSRHLRGIKKMPINPAVNATVTPPQHAIILSLLAMLDGNTASQVHVAYDTLRSLMSVLASDIPQWQSWPAEYREALEYLQSYPRIPATSQSRDMSELTTSESFQDGSKGFPEWIAMISTLLSDILAKTDAFYAQLTPILQSDAAFGEQMLPVLVQTVLQTEMSSNKPSTTSASYRHLLSNYFTSLLISNTVNNSYIRSIVDIILHLRHFRCPNSNDALSYDKWLDVNFTLLARNAITCGAYTTALLFLELAAEYRGPTVADDIAVEQIMFDIYSHIDEPDGFYGIKTKDLSHFLIKRFHHEQQWEKAFRFHGAALEAGCTTSVEAEGLIQAFHSFGFNHLAIDTLKSSNFDAGVTSRMSGMSYRSGWRAETWDLPDRVESACPDTNLYMAIRAIHRERDPRTIDSIVRGALAGEMGRLRALGTENLAEIREVSRNLMCISQVTQWRSPSMQKRLGLRQIDPNDWTEFIQIESGFEFTDLENIMATRISLIRAARQKEERDQIGTLVSPFAQFLKDIEKGCLVRLSEAARAVGQVQIALNSVVRSQTLENSPTFDVSQEFASVLWLQREQKLAVQYLKELLDSDTKLLNGGRINPTKKAQWLAQLGTWTSEACLEKPTDILTHFFDPATALIAGLDQIQEQDPTRATVYHQCAIFAEHQYHAILKSPDAIRWKVYMDRKVQEIKRRQDQISRTQTGSKELDDLTQDQRKAQALLQEDQALFQRHNGARDAFLSQAIEMYARCLEASDAFDDDGAIRLCSLWFSNFDNEALQDKVQIALNRVQSRKFVFLAHQLSARLSKSQAQQPAKNQDNLQRLMIRMCEEHPFHSLYQVYCLLPEHSVSSTTVKRHSSRNSSFASQSERGAAASDIFDRLRGDPEKGERVRDLERLCDASLQWAQFPIKDEKRHKNTKDKGLFKVPDNLLIRKIQKLRVPVITSHTPIDHTLRYDNCVWVESYEGTFETAGGINLPKISICYGSNGERYKQLFKGEGGDDLRQDAVMEQVFDLVNMVLHRDRETRRRNLSVRGYKVIPLAPQAGVLEFVGNTSPLQNWLYTAHLKYRPNDMRHTDIVKQLKALKGLPDDLLALFQDIRTRFKPVMRHYFTERHKNPISWFAMRLTYTRSVATTSIVGHILGLGDRHISNILLDNVTGDVVHIDLGIAFDQGKLLPVPERVPFRMTADMVDGMGMSGTQGVFQRCAEETLRVLRDGSEVIMTVLEVFKHDPLHSWTASELKLKRVQDPPPESTVNDTAYFGIGIDMTSGTADEAADRALNSVARKLDKKLSVEYTVNELIAEATDPLNLATIFAGWSPHF